MECPQCGHMNSEGDSFCSNCGTRLSRETTVPRQFEPPERRGAVTGQPASERLPEDPHDPKWRMSSLPEPEPPKRRVWLWVLIGILLFCVLLFCGFSIFIGYTDTGRDLMDDLATRAAEIATPVP